MSRRKKRGQVINYQARPEVREIASNRVIKALAAYDPGRFDYHERDPLTRYKGMKIIEEMLEDPQIQACMLVLRWSVIARGYSVQPADTPNGEEQASFIESVFENIKGTVEDALGRLTSCTAYGYSIGEIVYQALPAGPFAGKWGLRAIKSKKPGAFDFECDEFDNVLGIKPLGWSITAQTLPVDKFVIWTWQGEFENPYGSSVLRAAYAPWKRKQLIEKFEAVALDRFGMPTVLGRYPDGTPQDVQDKLLSVVKSLQSDNAGVVPEELPIELLEAKRQGSADYQAAIAHYNTEIALAILGQSLSTNQNEKTGSMAQAKVHQDTLMLVLGMIKRGLEETVLGEQVIRRLIDYNYGPQEAYPRVVFNSLQPENEKEIADTAKLLIEAKVNPKVVVEWLKDRIELPEVEGEELAAEEPELPEPEEEEPDDDPNPEPPKGGNFAAEFGREPTPWESRMDFAAMSRELDGLEMDAVLAASDVIRQMQDNLTKTIKSKGLFGKSGDLEAIGKLQVKGELTGKLRDVLQASLTAAIRRGDAKGRETIERLAGEAYSVNYASLGRFLTEWIAQKSTLFAGNVKDSLLSQVKQRLILAVQQDLSETEAMARVAEVFDPYLEIDAEAEEIAKAPRLRTIVRTNMTDGYNQGMRRFYEMETDGYVIAYQYSAVMDSRTTPFCRAWDGKILKVGDPRIERLTPPNHYNCRSMWVPLTKSDQFELTKDFPSVMPAEGFSAEGGCDCGKGT